MSIFFKSKPDKALLSDPSWDIAATPSDIFDAICQEYLIVIYIDFSKHQVKLLSHNDSLEADKLEIFSQEGLSIEDAVTQYASNYVASSDYKNFVNTFSRNYLVEKLKEQNIVSLRYTGVINDSPNRLAAKIQRVNNDPSKAVIRVLDIEHYAMEKRAHDTKLERANAVKTDFLMNMSHEFMTPLNAILGYTELAKREALENEELLDSLNMISGAGKTLFNLIQNMLNMNNLMNGNTQLKETPCSITELFDGITTVATYEAEKKDIHFIKNTYDIIYDNLYIDVPSLSRILIGLLSNANKFVDRNGTVIVSMTEFPADPETVTIEFRIKDNGIGMSDEFASMMFDIFSKEKSTTNNGKTGTGLGLSITAKLVEKLNGKISVNTKKGFGTEFTVTIPFKKVL